LKTIWITGASSGIGEMLAYRFADLGANLVLTARSIQRLELVKLKCNELNKNSFIHIVPFDLSKPLEARGFVE
jgi:dehydrogenase/reductase SDR family protein 7B